jgi:catechol 2,3-dioxygenase-like lactoylglutathione lyase family enzyme
MRVRHVIPQLRTTNLVESIAFYTTRLGFTLDFVHEDFYASVRTGTHVVHLKLTDDVDPSVEFVALGEHFHLYFDVEDAAAVADFLRQNGVPLVTELHETAWGTRELTIRDNQGHTLYFGEPL